jgi:methyltransferase-like protein/2-polyprenyl-3-methyl-5-hydroxy-6-metoxy-1,4-benzoquinol methylase
MTNPYDEVAYHGNAVPQTHPDRLATLATLFGRKPAAVDACRVLEIGCGNGNNLIPMAYALPGSRFVGIDLAAKAIAAGQAMIDPLGLKNIALRQLDILEAGKDLGEFDFIISHGVYGWVPPAVQDKLLAVCRELLAPEGVAYVSYDVYPGAHVGRLSREMMLYHVQKLEDPQEKIRQSRALIHFLAEGRSEKDFYGVFLKDEVRRIGEWSDWSIYHDNLAPNYSAVYFHQFIEHAGRHRLQFLAEADYFLMHPQTASEKVKELFQQLRREVIVREQYLDFYSFRHFRRTLLCHEGVQVEREIPLERLSRFYVASEVQPASPQPDIRSEAIVEFRGAREAAVSVSHPLAKAALAELSGIWPQALHFDELLDRSRVLAGHASKDRAEDARGLSEFLLRIYAANLIELHVYLPRIVCKPGERPMASPLARLQLEQGYRVTNLRHDTIDVQDALGETLVKLLDGTRDRAALRAELRRVVESGAVRFNENSAAPPSAEEIQKEIDSGLEERLEELGRFALLER